MKRAISLLVCIVMILSVTIVGANADLFDDYGCHGYLTLGLNKTGYEFEWDRYNGYFLFTADKDGYYEFTINYEIDTWHGISENFRLQDYDKFMDENCVGSITDFRRVYNSDDVCVLLDYVKKDQTIVVNLGYGGGNIEIGVYYQGDTYTCEYDKSLDLIDGLDFSRYEDEGNYEVNFEDFTAKFKFPYTGEVFTQNMDWYIKGEAAKNFGTGKTNMDWLNGEKLPIDVTIHDISEYVKSVKLPTGSDSKFAIYYNDSLETPEYITLTMTDGTQQKIEFGDCSKITINGKEVFAESSLYYPGEQFGVQLSKGYNYVTLFTEEKISFENANAFENLFHLLKRIPKIFADDFQIAVIDRVNYIECTKDFINDLSDEFELFVSSLNNN